MTTPKVRLRKWNHEVVSDINMIIRAVIRSIYPAFTLYFTFRKSASLSDAEMFEDVFKHLWRGDLTACDVCQLVKANAQFFRY